MAYIRKRLDAYQVMVRRYGYAPRSKTFRKLTDAKAWARKIESEMERGAFIDDLQARETTLAQLLSRYEREVLPSKRSVDTVKSQIKVIKRLIGDSSLKEVTTHLLNEQLIKKRSVDGQTIRKDLSLIQRVLNTAMKDWGIHLPQGNPVSQMRLPKSPPGRERRLAPDEEARLLSALKPMPEVLPVVQLALETGMRRGELVGMEWQHIDWTKRTLLIPVTKTDTPRTIPLSSRAVATLQSIPRRIDGRVFGIRADSVTQAFSRACKRAGIEGLRFHDLRHEATSRLFELGLGLMEVASITGHKDLRMLRRYTHLRAEDLVKKLA